MYGFCGLTRLEKKSMFFTALQTNGRFISACIKHFKKWQSDNNLLDKLFHPQK